MDFSTQILDDKSVVAKPGPDDLDLPHQLCDKCQPVAESLPAYAKQVEIHGLKTPRISYEHHSSLSGLVESARRGCHLCSILTDTLSVWQDDGDSIKENKIRDANSNDSLRIVTSVHWMTAETRCLKFCIDVHHPDGAERAPYAMVHRHLKDPPNPEFDPSCESTTIEREAQWPQESKYRWSKSTGSRAAHELLKKQLDKCLADHEGCTKGSLLDFKSTRLLDLSPFGNSDSMDIRVVPGSTTSSAPYATLSYCLGGISTADLNPSNHDVYHERIPWIDLTKTMRDAVLTCRRLSVRYLWIASLCIVQGPDGDFVQETTRMQAVFSGSMFTIAAADSSNPHGGCYRERFPLRYADCRIYEDEKQLVFIKAVAPCDSILGGKFRDLSESTGNGSTPGNCILDKRAWVFQERMLSPRTLYFGRGDIHFECREELICESKPSEESGHPHSYYLSLKRTYLKLIKLDTYPFEEACQRFQRLWREILESYSQTSLRHEEDRLSAIAGIVSIPQKLLGLRSSYGLWEAFFIDELCWYVADGRRSSERRRSQFDHLPTWSWLSLVDSEVVNMEDIPYRSEPLDRLYNAKVTELPESTPYVQLPKLSAYRSTLKLKARVIRCRATKIENSIGRGLWALVPFTLPPREVYGDEELDEPSAPSKSTLQKLYDSMSERRICSFDADLPDTLNEGQTLHCLLIKRDRMTDRFGTVHVWDFCLVLHMEEGERGVFTRVGAYCEGNSKLDIKEREGKMSYDDADEEDDELMEMLVTRRLMFPGEQGEETEVVVR